MAKKFQLFKGGVTEELANRVAEMAEEKGLTLSRWQANKGGHATTITYAVHTGERAAQFRHQPADSVVEYERMNQLEGSTPRSEAYKKLAKLADVVAEY